MNDAVSSAQKIIIWAAEAMMVALDCGLMGFLEDEFVVWG